MIRRLLVIITLTFTLALALAPLGLAQNANTSTQATRRRTTTTTTTRTTAAPPATAKGPEESGAQQPATTAQPGKRRAAGSQAVVTVRNQAATTPLAAFNSLLDGIRRADVSGVMNVYWNSPRLILFNNNGTVTRGWEQVRRNRESSYPEMKDVKLDVRDVHVEMLGRDGALVTCLWTQAQTFRGTPESASGRMTITFRRVGNAWKAVHLHTSPDAPEPSRIMPSERATPTAAPASKPRQTP
jgi:ketosteroid isomerase-like protein